MKKIILSLSILCSATTLLAQNNILAIIASDATQIKAESIQYLNGEKSFNSLEADLTQLPVDKFAALALDQSMENLVFMDLNSTAVQIYNLKTKTITTLPNSGEINGKCSLSAQFSRMTLSPNGNIYAINNNSTSVLEISKVGDQFKVKDLGGLVDLSKAQSLLASNSGWGGDMIADDQGTLFIISAFGNIFSINLEEMTADYFGEIKNLPKGFTTNGCAVDANGDIVLANAQGKGSIVVDFKELSFDKITPSQFCVYDLASPYFLKSDVNNSIAVKNFEINPTRLTNRTLHLENKRTDLKGQGTIEVLDINGQSVWKQSINLSKSSFEFNINKVRNVGYYIVKLYDSNKSELHSEKIMIVN